MARALNVPTGRVRAIVPPLGGSFGGKQAMTCHIEAALMTYLTKRPVQCVWSREESLRLSTKRHPARFRMRMGAKRDGHMTAFDCDFLLDAGAYGDAVVVDIRDVPDGGLVCKDDLIARLEKMNYKLKPGDIFLTQTGNDKLWGTPEFMTHGGHLDAEALRWVLDQGIHTVGTDSWSFDRAYEWWSEDYKKNNYDPKWLWPCHLLCIQKEYAHIEKLANLDKVPPFGWKLMAFPIKFFKGTAGFVRAVAFIED